MAGAWREEWQALGRWRALGGEGSAGDSAAIGGRLGVGGWRAAECCEAAAQSLCLATAGGGSWHRHGWRAVGGGVGS